MPGPMGLISEDFGILTRSEFRACTSVEFSLHSAFGDAVQHRAWGFWVPAWSYNVRFCDREGDKDTVVARAATGQSREQERKFFHAKCCLRSFLPCHLPSEDPGMYVRIIIAVSQICRRGRASKAMLSRATFEKPCSSVSYRSCWEPAV